MEFLSTLSNSDNQSVFLIIFSVLLAFLLSTLIVFTYEKTSREVAVPHHFIQSLILMAIVTATIMQSIGDSLARGFGIFGALAILRFRTNLISTRNISFIFAAMAAGIACGVYSFLTALIGTLAFCLIAFLLVLTPFSRKSNLLGDLRFELPPEPMERDDLEKIIRRHSADFVLKRYRLLHAEGRGEYVEYTFQLRLKQEQQAILLARALRALPEMQALRFTLNDTYVNLTD